jgi:hypothetical protein
MTSSCTRWEQVDRFHGVRQASVRTSPPARLPLGCRKEPVTFAAPATTSARLLSVVQRHQASGLPITGLPVNPGGAVTY